MQSDKHKLQKCVCFTKVFLLCSTQTAADRSFLGVEVKYLMFPTAGCVQIRAALTTRTCERTKQRISTCAAVFKYKTQNWETKCGKYDTEIFILSTSTLQ